MWGGTDDIYAALRKKLDSNRGRTENLGGKVVANSMDDGVIKSDVKDNHVKLGDAQRKQQRNEDAQEPSRSRVTATGTSEKEFIQGRSAGRLHSVDVAHGRAITDRKRQPQSRHSDGKMVGSKDHHVNHDNMKHTFNSKHGTVMWNREENKHFAYQKIGKDAGNKLKNAEASSSSLRGIDMQEEINQGSNGLSVVQKTAEHNSKQKFLRKQNFKRRNKNLEDKSEFRKQRTREISYHYLKDLSEKSPLDITFCLETEYEKFDQLLQSTEIQADIVFLIVKVLSRVCAAELVHLKSSVLSVACKPDFLDQLKMYIVVHLPKLESQEDIIAFCKNCLIFFNTVVKLFSLSVCDNIKKVLVPMLNTVVEIEEDFKGSVIYKDICDEVKTLLDQVNTASVMFSSNNSQNKEDKLFDLYDSSFDRPRDNFRTVSHLPTAKEILSHRGIVYRNIVKGSYRSVEHYLEVQYRLLREDFVGPLRTGIQEYIDSLMNDVDKKKRRINNVRIYPHVKFLSSSVKDNKFGFLIDYDLSKQFVKVNWEFSKRFIFGSLLLFTTDSFKSFFIAKVLERDIDTLKEGKLYVEIAPEAKLPENLMSLEFVMAESEIYFEPYYHVLIALQTINEDNFPMKRYIIDAKKDTLLPVYLNDVTRVYKIGKHMVKIGNNDGNRVGTDSNDGYYYYSETNARLPSAEDLHLDNSQYTAFKAALTSEFVAIQGPPGTGKTFLGLKIAEVLLKSLSSDMFPILVICYTNHALDQFLEGILRYTDNIVRIGGRSQNEALSKFNLRYRRINCRFNRSTWFLTHRILDCLHEMLTKIISLDNILQKKMFDGVLSIETFEGIMNTKQYEKLKDCFVDWLMEDSLEFYVSNRNEMLQDGSDQVGKIHAENEGDVSQVDSETMNNDTDNNETVNSQMVEEGATAVNGGEDENRFEEEDDELSKQRQSERCLDFEPEILFDPSLVETHHSPVLCLKLRDLGDEIQYLEYRLTELSEGADEDGLHLYDRSLINDYLHIQQELNEKKMSYNYLCARLTEKINLKVVNQRQLHNEEDVFSLSSNERWALYHWWLQRLFDSYSVKIKECEETYRKLSLKHCELMQLDDVELLKDVQVIGMTTSGAASRRTMIENLNTRIVIVEEAAEVLEAHIITALNKRCEHVILIGDHQQLRPNPAVYELAKHFQLDVSLFERMLKNGLNCHTLSTQHRMRPEISSLIAPAIYPHLQNHLSVHGRANIKGVTSNLYFITHTNFEDEVIERHSKMNSYEGDFLIRLCKHLLYQGYTGEEITILTTYSGQMMYMRKKKRGDPMLKDVRITVVDNFQGEENKIILLSLVRSNALARIGFLSTENRVCVALSRARDGLYIIGNMENLTESSTIWKKIKSQLENLNALGPALTLRCVNHNKTIRVSSAVDFKLSPEGGCTELCNADLPCGHKCQRNCHVLDSDHSSNENCTQPCERYCIRGLHKCAKRCNDECGECQISVAWVLKCGHKNSIPCHMDPLKYDCKEMVRVSLLLCGHANDKLCYLDIDKVRCKSSCEDRLPCGHSCVQKCHKNRDPDHIDYKCKKPCTKKSVNCTENHTCAKLCSEECGTCVVMRLKELPCGHMHNLKCSVDVSSVKCMKSCMKMLPCGHPCTDICSAVCGDCKQIVSKVLPECGHEVKAACSDEPDRSACKAKCERTLQCGHKCKGMCKINCEDLQCHELVESCEMPACGHPGVMVPCCENKKGLLFQSILEQYCRHPCKSLLECGHECTGDCYSCMQGRIHVPCTERREKALVCGHKYTLECNENSAYCGKSCLYECQHSKCGNRCGIQCKQCQRRCDWACKHERCTKNCFEMCNRKPCNEPCAELLACGHPCIGFCGEVCPRLCRLCHKEELSEIFADFEKKPDARFVVLEDCRHCVESDHLENYLKISKDYNDVKDDKEIFLKTCPVCLTPINKTKRYRNEVKLFYQQLVKLRGKVNASNNELENLRRQLVSTLQDIRKIPSPLQSFATELASDRISQGKKGVIQAEILAKCFISEVIILISEKYKLLMMITSKTDKVMTDALTIKLNVIVNAIKLHLKRISVYEMMCISNEVHRVLRLMEFAVLLSIRSVCENLLSIGGVDCIAAMIMFGIRDILFSLNRYSLRDDDMVKAVLHGINEGHVPEDLVSMRTSLISNYKLCVSQMKCVNLCEVQWFVCDKGHTYIMRTFDDVVLRCECNQNNDTGRIEIQLHMAYSSHRRNNFNENNKQHSVHHSRSPSVSSIGSSKLSKDSNPHRPNSRQNDGRKQEANGSVGNENWRKRNQCAESERGGMGRGNRGGRLGNFLQANSSNFPPANDRGIPSLLNMSVGQPHVEFSAARGGYNNRGRRGRGRGRRRGRGQRY